MLAENKNPTAYGTYGECMIQQPVLSLPKGRNSYIEYPASLVRHSSCHAVALGEGGSATAGESNFSSLYPPRRI